MENPARDFAILVVEDEPMIRAGTAESIEEAGYTVYEACNASQALRLLSERRDIAVLFTDVEMPGLMDGVELAQYASRNFHPLSILVTSGRYKLDAALLPDGAVFLSKPYRLATVMDELRRMAG